MMKRTHYLFSIIMFLAVVPLSVFMSSCNGGGEQGEDCVSMDPSSVEVKKADGSWKIAEGDHWIADFGSKEGEAKRALQIIKHYKLDQYCYVGRPDPSFEYLLSGGKAPSGNMKGEDCITFNPDKIKVKQVDGSWKIVEGDHLIYDFGDKKKEAQTALKRIKKYGFNQSCYVGRPDPSFHYLKKGKPGDNGNGEETAFEEDCISMNPGETEVKKMDGNWKIVEGDHLIDDFGDKEKEARKALQVIKNYELDKYCYVGRPDPSFQYLLSGDEAPSGSMKDEDCVSFSNGNLEVKKMDGNWKIVDGDHLLFDFGDKESEARKALKAIKKYGFTKSCFVGRPDPSFNYLKK